MFVSSKRLSAPLIEILPLPVALAAGPEIRGRWSAPEFLDELQEGIDGLVAFIVHYKNFDGRVGFQLCGRRLVQNHASAVKTTTQTRHDLLLLVEPAVLLNHFPGPDETGTARPMRGPKHFEVFFVFLPLA
jgi:hypothetical protein